MCIRLLASQWLGELETVSWPVKPKFFTVWALYGTRVLSAFA